MKSTHIRPDHKIIFDTIETGSKVLDLGCGNCELLSLLVLEKKHITAIGIELDEDEVYECVEKGISVLHGDIETGLHGYPDKAFDYVILNQSLQETKNVIYVMDEALRVGNKVILGFPNFAHISSRLMLFFKGKTPILSSLPYKWYNTPNLHFLSISDFKEFCREKNITILKTCYLGENHLIRFLPNLLALNAIFVITQ
jgi:methionine biosynthesis protein MetW